jgi:indolepyruvate ferredoxin oxidoreductase, alpha subunit
MVVLDNGATVTSGTQPHPGVARDARGRRAPALDIERISRACVVEHVHTVGPGNLDAQLRPLINEGLTRPRFRLIVGASRCQT